MYYSTNSTFGQRTFIGDFVSTEFDFYEQSFALDEREYSFFAPTYQALPNPQSHFDLDFYCQLETNTSLLDASFGAATGISDVPITPATSTERTQFEMNSYSPVSETSSGWTQGGSPPGDEPLTPEWLSHSSPTVQQGTAATALLEAAPEEISPSFNSHFPEIPSAKVTQSPLLAGTVGHPPAMVALPSPPITQSATPPTGEKKRYQCGKCHFSTDRTFNLNRHVTNHHANGNREMFRCDYCPKGMTRWDNMRKHMYTCQGRSKISVVENREDEAGPNKRRRLD